MAESAKQSAEAAKLGVAEEAERARALEDAAQRELAAAKAHEAQVTSYAAEPSPPLLPVVTRHPSSPSRGGTWQVKSYAAELAAQSANESAAHAERMAALDLS